MQKALIITEKPSVARDIAGVLKAKQKRDGFIEGDAYLITWAVGHLITLCEPEDYDAKYKRWDYNTLPIIPESIQTKPYPKTKSQLKIIRQLAKRTDVDRLICATDSGREGELIFRYIYEYMKCSKPFQRLWISSMTDESILKGFEQLKPSSVYDPLYHSARCRSEADWLVGINATRAYTSLNQVLLSVGRVQTPTLALIVNRQLEIESFKPQDYFEVIADYGHFTGIWYDEKPSETKIFDGEQAKSIQEKIKGQEALVFDVEKKKKKEKAPLLYDLTELQRDGNKLYGYSAKKVLELAQNLYERHKLLTYPRTDSRYLTDDMKPVVKATLEKMMIAPYDRFIEPVLSKGLTFSKRIIDNSKVSDHHAIIPTNQKPNLNRLNGDELNIFNLVLKRLIAVFYEDFIFETTQVCARCQEETFVSKGKVVLQRGWKALYKPGKDEQDQELPSVKKGDVLQVVDSRLEAKQTSPPKPYTEGTLLSAMENAGRFVEEADLKEQLKASGFGTPATRAGIIERLIQVQYIFRKGKSLYATEKGVNLIRLVPEELQSPVTTGKWEKGLNKIAQGEMDPDQFMASINRFVQYLVKKAYETKGTIRFESEKKGSKSAVPDKHLGACPVCQTGFILEHSKGFYCTKWQSTCKTTYWKDQFKSKGFMIDAIMMSSLIATGHCEKIHEGIIYRLAFNENKAVIVTSEVKQT